MPLLNADSTYPLQFSKRHHLKSLLYVILGLKETLFFWKLAGVHGKYSLKLRLQKFIQFAHMHMNKPFYVFFS